jgi:hypothetical protein
MNPSLLLGDGHLLFVVALAAVVSWLTTLNVAARPAAVLTRQVATAFTISNLFFMLTRFANLFYLPFLATYVDEAVQTGRADILTARIRWVVAGAALGALVAWLLLPTLVQVYARGVQALQRHKMSWILVRLPTPRGLRALGGCLRPPSLLGTRLFRLEGLPADFLLFNVAATAIWTVGALAALLASALRPEFAATAVLLSGLVNSFAAIAFNVFVEPRAAVVTDQAIDGLRPERQVRVMAVHLAAGNFLGAGLGLLVLGPATRVIEAAAVALGVKGESLSAHLGLVLALNALVTLLASTTGLARVAAVLTRRVATALAVYNLFFLITRLAGQIYAPLLGSMRDFAVRSGDVAGLERDFRWVILGASAGAALALLLMPTFVELYSRAVRGLDRLGSMPRLVLAALHPRSWPGLVRCLRAPSFFGLGLGDLGPLPREFLIGNVLVVSVHTMGVLAAIYAGALLSEDLARTATLLSSVVNGIATITLSVVVDPTAARLTDQAVDGLRPPRQIYAMAVFLLLGTLLGTLLSQVFFGPAAWVIMAGARALDWLF